MEVLQDEDPFPDEDEDLAYEHVEPSSAPPPSRSTHVEEPPKRGGSERRPETRSSPAAQPRHDDEYGYAHGDGGSDPRGAKGASAGSGSGGAGAGGGFGFGNTGTLFGKVMGGVSIVSEKATKLGKEAVKVASEKSSQVKQFVNQTLLEESTGPRVRRENVKELMDMGFSEDDSTCALYVARNDVFDALDILKSTEKLNEARHAYRKAASAPRSQGEQGSGEGQRPSHPPQQQPSQPSQQTQQQQRSRSQTPNAVAAQKSAAQKFDDMVDQMTGMGYTLNDAYDSLAVTNDVEKAIEILTKKGVKPERRSQAAPPQQQPPQQQPQQAPRQASSQPTQAAARTQQQPSQQPQQQPVSRTATPSAKEAAAKFDEMVDSLMAMGFTMGDAYDALATTNDFDKAVEFLQKKNQPQKVPAHRTQASQPSQPSQSQSQPQPQQQRPQSQNQPSQARPQQSPPSSGQPTPKAPSPKPATPKVVDAPPLAPQVEQQVAAIKEKGNAFFKAGDFAAARGNFFLPLLISFCVCFSYPHLTCSPLLLLLDVYNEALKLIPEGHPASVPLLNNRGACYLKMDSFKPAIEDCTKVLKLTNNTDTKALLRRVGSSLHSFRLCDFTFSVQAQAYEALEQLDASFADFKQILSLDPSVIAASQGTQRVSKAMRTLEKSKREEAAPKPPKPVEDMISDHPAPAAKTASKASSPSPAASSSSSNPNDFSMFESLE